MFVAVVTASCGDGRGGSGAERSSTSTARAAATAAPARVSVVDAPWTLTSPVAREVVVRSGARFTVVGGLDATKFSTASIVSVDPASGTSRATGTLTEAVHDAAGVHEGTRILVFGGGGPSENGTAAVQAVAADGSTTNLGALPGPRSRPRRRSRRPRNLPVRWIRRRHDRARHPADDRRHDLHQGRSAPCARALSGDRRRGPVGVPVRGREQL